MGQRGNMRSICCQVRLPWRVKVSQQCIAEPSFAVPCRASKYLNTSRGKASQCNAHLLQLTTGHATSNPPGQRPTMVGCPPHKVGMGDWNGVPRPATTNHPGQRPAAAGCPAPARVGLGDWYGGPLPDSKLVWITSQRAPLKEHPSQKHVMKPHSN